MQPLRVQNGVTYNCTDIESAHFEMGHQESQAMLPWEDATKYARWTMWFVIVTVFILMVKRAANILADHRNKNAKSFYIPLRSSITAICRYIGYRRLPSFVTKYTIFPSSVGIVLYVLAGLLFLLCICFIPHFWYRTCFKFGSPPMAVRAGLISNALTPVIFALSGKVNVVTALTGVSYEKLNIFHSASAWTSFLFAWIHAVPFLVQPVWEGGYGWLNHFFTTSIYDISGTVATILLAILCLCSLGTIRENFYEVFLHVHWPTAIAYLGVLFWHDDQALESWSYLWGTLAVYAAGLLYRYFKKTNYLQLRGNWFTNDVANITVLPDRAVEVSIFSRLPIRWLPGEHIFIRFLSIEPLSNHPFTLAGLPEYDQTSGFTKMRLIARPYSGFTKRLFEQASNKLTQSQKVLWDGPYGGVDRDVLSFDDVFLVCSGSGSTAVIPFLKYIALELSKGRQLPVKRIKILWCVRYLEAFEWFRKDIEDAFNLLPDPSLAEFHLHITGGRAPTDHPSSSDVTEKKIDEATSSASSATNTVPSNISIDHSRANIRTKLTDWSSQSGARTIIISSGCQSVRNDTANTAASLQKRILLRQKTDSGSAAKEIYLHTETFGW